MKIQICFFSLLVFILFSLNAGENSVLKKIDYAMPLFLENLEEPSCSSILATDSIANLKDFHIPFTINEHLEDTNGYTPAIDVVINGVPVKMGVTIDGMNAEIQVYTSLLKKIGGQNLVDEVWNNIEKETRLKYSDGEITDSMRQDIINRRDISINLSDININGSLLGNIEARYYNTQEYSSASLDGVLCTLFFSKCKNVIVDYRKNEIIVNGDAIVSNGSPMRLLKDTYLLSTKIKINGIEQDAIISPTLSAVYLRDDYKSSKKYSDEEILHFCYNGTPRYYNNKYKNIVLTVDDIDMQCKGYFTSRRRGEITGDFVENMVRKINIIGYPVFKGHRIQLDFKNGLFRMD